MLMEHLTISDHLPLFVSTKYGVFGTMNLWCPGTPIAPTQNPSGMTGLYRILDEVNQNDQLDKQAHYLVDLFCSGVDAILLQEVSYLKFNYFFDRLAWHTADKMLELELEEAKRLYSRIKKNGNYANFGCTLLTRKNLFQFNHQTQVNSILDERGFVYTLEATDENKKKSQVIKLHNIHGNLLYSNDLADYIQLHAKDHDIVGGDFNISITLNEVLDVLRTVNGAASLTPITNSYVDKKSMTLDGLYLSTEIFESEFLFEDYLTRENL